MTYSIIMICFALILGMFSIVLAVWVKTLEAIVKHLANAHISVSVTQSTPDAPVVESALSKAEQEVIDKYNEDQRIFMASCRNLQSIFLDDEQLIKEANG